MLPKPHLGGLELTLIVRQRKKRVVLAQLERVGRVGVHTRGLPVHTQEHRVVKTSTRLPAPSILLRRSRDAFEPQLFAAVHQANAATSVPCTGQDVPKCLARELFKRIAVYLWRVWRMREYSIVEF